MDLKEEFEKIGSTVDDIKPIVRDLYLQKEEMEKKIHLFNVISFSRGMIELLNTKVISSSNVSALNFRHYMDHETGMNNIMFDLVDLKGKEIDSEFLTEEKNDIWGDVMSLLSSNALSSFDSSLVNSEFKENVIKTISLLENTENEIINLFLNSELKKVYEYHKMNDNLPINNAVGRKSKI
jgi:hypothetical protein